MSSRLINVAYFNNAMDNHPRQRRREWNEFRDEHITSPIVIPRGQTCERAKRGLRAFSLNQYIPGTTRGKANVISVDGLVFDIDQAKGAPASAHVTISEFHEILIALDVEAWIYETFSCTPEFPRFRVVIPTDEPVFPQDWQRFVDSSLVHLGLDSPRILAALDLKATRDISRIWFLPAVWGVA